MRATSAMRQVKNIVSQKNTNTAFVHCRVLPGGALKIFEELIKKTVIPGLTRNFSKDTGSGPAWQEICSGWQKASQNMIFTLTSDRESLYVEGVGDIKIVTALPRWLNKLFQHFSFHRVPVISFFCDYRNLMFFYPVLMKILSHKIRRYQPKEIVISSFAVGKNLEMCKVSNTQEIATSLAPHNDRDTTDIRLYLHSPMQYIRSHYNDYIHKLKGLKLWIFKKITKRLRKWDQKYTHYDEVVANSQYTAKLAKEIYDIDAIVEYPNLDGIFFHQDINSKPSNYYIYMWRLTKLVREADTVIKLFNKMKQPLLVMWSGPDEEELKKLSGETIIFLWWIENKQEKINLIKNSKWLINLTKESFGIWTAEALLLGVPVFGLDDGATPELVDEESGVLVKKEDFDKLNERFIEFVSKDWDRKKIWKNILNKLWIN